MPRKLISSRNVTSFVKQAGGYRHCKYTNGLQKQFGGNIRAGTEVRPLRGAQGGGRRSSGKRVKKNSKSLRRTHHRRRQQGGNIRSGTEMRPLRGAQGGGRRSHRKRH